MYFKDFPSYLYDFNYGNGVIKTTVVKDITRNIRFKKEILENIALYDEYDIVDGETPEIISEKIYGTPEYHWVIMLANDKYDYRSDFPVPEPILQKHITSYYNPELHSLVTDWRFNGDNIVFKIHDSLMTFDVRYLTHPVEYHLSGETDQGSFDYTFTWQEIYGGATFDYLTQSFTQTLNSSHIIRGTPKSRLTITTSGREHNPVFFVNTKGLRVSPDSSGAIPVTGDQLHRYENDKKRRIKIISPSLLETVIKNYEQFLK